MAKVVVAHRTTGSPRRGEPVSSAPLAFELPSRSDRRAIALGRLLRIIPIVLVVASVGLAVTTTLVIGVVFALVFAMVFAGNLWIGSSRRIVRSLNAREANQDTDARLINVVDGLCVANGLRRPTIAVLDDDALNAIVIGRFEQAAVFIVTSGLLAALDRMELEGIVAHALAQVKRRDIVRARTATTALGLIVALLPKSARALARLSGIGNVAYEDLAAVSMTRYPPGLIAALRQVRDARTTRPRAISPLTARLTAAMWLVPLSEAIPIRPVEAVLDLELRSAALREL